MTEELQLPYVISSQTAVVVTCVWASLLSYLWEQAFEGERRISARGLLLLGGRKLNVA